MSVKGDRNNFTVEGPLVDVIDMISEVLKIE